MDLECYDLHWWWDGDNEILRLQALADDGDGGKELLEFGAPFDPYCYIEEGEYQSALDPMQMCGCRFGDDPPEGFLKIEADHPNAIKDFRESFAFKTYEADVHFNRRAAINEGVTFKRPSPEQTLYFDIEVDDRKGFAEPEDADKRVIAIAAVDGGGREYYFDDAEEADLLEGFFEAAKGYVALAGWNSLDYDYRYLENRVPKVFGKQYTVRWKHWVRHDLMPLYDMLAVPTKTVSLKLDDTGERELGEGKTGVRPGDGRLHGLWATEPDRLREYNLRDADLVRRIDEKYGLVELLHVICDICNYPPGDACYLSKYGQVRFAIGQVVDSKLLTVAHQKGIPQPNKRSYEKPDDFPGGYVLEPEPGMYENVVVPDYSGMYPNIVRAWNFGRETWVPGGSIGRGEDGGWVVTEGRWEGCRAIRGETGGFVHPDDGDRSVPAEAADDLVSIREGAADIVDKGVKAVNNTLYGVFAADHQRYFGPHSENITLVGQKLTGVVERIAGAGHRYIKKVVYGDTDSVMIEMDPGPEGPVDAAHEIASDVEEEMQEWARGRGAMAEYLKLDVDDVYDRFYIGDKKKRYFGHRIFSGGEYVDNFKVRGFEVRQGDWPRPVRDFQEDLMHAKLAGEGIKEIIDEARENLFSGKWDLEMATSTKLNQPIAEYVHPQPHTRAAEGIRSRFGHGSVQVGDKVDYIKYGGDKEDVIWVYDGEIGTDFRENEGWCGECGQVVRREGHPHETAGHPHLRDSHYGYLWRKKFKSVMESIGVAEFEQTGLGAFA